MDDYQLLHSYASRRGEDAFRTLTERYLGLVYSAARRQTGNTQAAEDVTQAVFLTLARKAAMISRKTILAGWLLRTTRYTAAKSQTESPAAAIVLQPTLGQLLLRVVDSQTAAPVTNARLTLVSSGAPSQRTTNTFITDAHGATLISYSPAATKPWSYQIEVFRDGYVPKYVSWSEYQQDRIDEIPAEYTARLDPAVTIGGLVVDGQDAPVTGVRIVFSVSGPTASRSRERLTMMGYYHTEVTGSDGRWSCRHVPPPSG
jgi:hypothetical protein